MSDPRIRPLTSTGFGGLIVEAEYEPVALAEALHRFGVLLLREWDATADALLSLARKLGQPESVRPPEHRLLEFEAVRLQSNLPGVGINGGGAYWHSDGSWKPEPTAATLLMCQTAPGRGGSTTFVDARALYRELEPELKFRVETEQGFYPCRQILRDELAALEITDEVFLASTPDVQHHPLVRTHPRTGERALLLNEQWLKPRSSEMADLLDELYGRVEQVPARYEHDWRKGDVLIWDNWVTMHRATEPPPGQAKVMLRVTVERWAP